MNQKVVPFFPAARAEQLIRELAAKGEFTFEPVFHAKMRDRDFSTRHVLDCLTGGSINQGPELDECGDWRCRLRRRVAGRLVRVVLAIHDYRHLYLISVH